MPEWRIKKNYKRLIYYIYLFLFHKCTLLFFIFPNKTVCISVQSNISVTPFYNSLFYIVREIYPITQMCSYVFQPWCPLKRPNIVLNIILTPKQLGFLERRRTRSRTRYIRFITVHVSTINVYLQQMNAETTDMQYRLDGIRNYERTDSVSVVLMTPRQKPTQRWIVQSCSFVFEEGGNDTGQNDSYRKWCYLCIFKRRWRIQS